MPKFIWIERKYAEFVTSEDCKLQRGIFLNLMVMGVETKTGFCFKIILMADNAYIHTLNFTLLYRLNNKVLYM